jgi:8-oxo-dGTP pyrophosphatase MutT (NUDIX family)
MAASMTAWLKASVARQPRLHRLANFAARRMAGRPFVCSSAVVVDGDDVLVARHRFRGGTWGLPGGWIKRREEPADACEREVFEETGIEVDAIAILAAEVHAPSGQPAHYFGLTLVYYCVPRAPVESTGRGRLYQLK